VKCYYRELQLTQDHNLQIRLLSNSALSYFNLDLYEDALSTAKSALDIDPKQKDALYLKAKSLAHLQEFSRSGYIFSKLEDKEELENLLYMKE